MKNFCAMGTGGNYGSNPAIQGFLSQQMISGLESSITCWIVDQEIVYSRVETRQAPIQTDPKSLFSILNENAMWQALLIIMLRKHHLIHVTS
jgi:hypothetical protein